MGAIEMRAQVVKKSIDSTANELNALINDFENLNNYITANPPENIYNADGALTSDRQVDFDGFTMQWIGLGEFYAEATNAPTVGNASFEFAGYGTSNGDVVFRESNGAGAAIRESFGDLNQRFYGKLFFSSNGSYIGKSPFSDNPAIIVADGGYYFGVDNASQTWQGNLGGRSHHLNSSNSSNYTEWSDNAGTRYVRVGRLSDNYKVSGYIVNDGVNIDLINFDAITGRTSLAKQVDFSSGVTKHNGLTTTEINALTAEAGMIVYNRTTNKHQGYDGSTWNNLY